MHQIPTKKCSFWPSRVGDDCFHTGGVCRSYGRFSLELASYQFRVMRTACASLGLTGVTSNGELTVMDALPPGVDAVLQFWHFGIMGSLLFYSRPNNEGPSVVDPPVGRLRLFSRRYFRSLLVEFCLSWLRHILPMRIYHWLYWWIWGYFQWRTNSDDRQSPKRHPVWIQLLISKFPSTSFQTFFFALHAIEFLSGKIVGTLVNPLLNKDAPPLAGLTCLEPGRGSI